MKVSGIIVSFNSLLGKNIDELELGATASSPVVILRSADREYIITGIRTCCNVLLIDHVAGDIDDFVASGPITQADLDDDGLVTLATGTEQLTMQWRATRAVKRLSDYIKLRERRR